MWATSVARDLALLWLILAAPAGAQSKPVVTEADVSKARLVQPVVTERDVQRAREQNRAPTDAELRRAPASAAPRIDKLPTPLVAQPPDLGAVAGGFAGAAQLPGTPISSPSLLIFISFAMPQATLARLVDQASRLQATLVLRGMVEGSLVRTTTRVQQLIAGRQVAVQIDPVAFDRYGVTQTPTFVVARAEAERPPCANRACTNADSFSMVSGDVSLDYALRHMQRRSPGIAADATRFLRLLER